MSFSRDVFMSSWKGNLFYGLQKGECFFLCSLDFCWLKNHVCLFVHGCFGIQAASGAPKRDSLLLSANLEGLWEAGWEWPFPQRGIMEIRKGEISSKGASWYVCLNVVVLSSVCLWIWTNVLTFSEGQCRDVAVSGWCSELTKSGQRLKPHWVIWFSSWPWET